MKKDDTAVSSGTKTNAIRKFSKEKILTSTQFSSIEKDILKSILKDDVKYSIDDAKKIIEEFYKKEVK